MMAEINTKKVGFFLKPAFSKHPDFSPFSWSI